ncbi:hypothetical protein GOP47_0002748 [Adiantum capillus-veneris]|uniref:Uncharacterized protein n=1 Tax=Adiantum capillus-veneris TaxID=13818 RepID=A0A9D4ZRW7_ADICA|nr:hypothetical protein GOP47_0002748 [Adiantum capillus-veneris]
MADMADQQRRSRNSWPWRKLKLGSSSTPKAGDKSSRFSTSQAASPASSFKAEESARFIENSWKQEASCSSGIEDVRIGEAITLREKAEESLKALKQELATLVKELTTKEALVKQHQKVADDAVSGWEIADKEVLSLTLELEAASKKKAILEDRIIQLDGALKECMRQVRLVREEQEAKTRDAITSKTKEWAEEKADMDAKQAELQRKLMESDAQNSAMVKSLQERARRILEANEAKSKTDAELKVMQVKLASAEKDISSLKYELHLLSKELEIRNEEVAYCKKSADVAHKQHLDNVQKVAKLEADCLRLRILVKKKLPGPAAITQMRKEVEGLPPKESTTTSATTPEFKRRPSRSYASSTISFTNSSHQRGTTGNTNRNSESLRDRLVSVEEENKLLKEALSKRINELQASWLLCAKTANKLCIAEDHLESLQGTPRDPAKIDRSFDFTFTTPGTPSIASVSDAETGFGGPDDVEEASCAESWASALIGELAHFKREKIITKEAIKEVTESYTTKESSPSANVGHEVQHEEKPQVANDTLPEVGMLAPLKLGDVFQPQYDQVKVISILCEDLDDKLGKIEEALRAGSENEKLIGLVVETQTTFSHLEKKIQGLKSSPTKSGTPDQVLARNNIATQTITSSEIEELGVDLGMRVPTVESVKATLVMQAEGLISDASTPMSHVATLKCQEGQSKMDAHPSLGADVNVIKHCDAEKHELGFSSSFDSVISKLIALLDMLPRDATLDADSGALDQEKLDLSACKDRFLQGEASVLEILTRVGVLLCRACHVGSQELDHVIASFIKTDMAAQQVGVGAAGFSNLLPSQQQQGEGGAAKVDELDADMATGGAHKNSDELDAVSKEYLPTDEVEGSVAAGEVTLEDCDDVNADRASTGRCNPDQVAEGGERDANVASAGEVDAVLLASQMQSEKEREGVAELEEAQAQVAHYKMLHAQLQTKNEELQVKLQGLQVEDDDCNAVKLLNFGEGMKQAAKEMSGDSNLVDAKEKLAECERTILDLGKQLNALSSSKPAPPLPRHRFVNHANMDVQPHISQLPTRQRGWSSSCQAVSGPQDATPTPTSAASHSQLIKARRQRYMPDTSDWLQQLDDHDSPPLSAMSSPARSPGRYTQQLSGRGARTSLTESLDAGSSPDRETAKGVAIDEHRCWICTVCTHLTIIIYAFWMKKTLIYSKIALKSWRLSQMFKRALC